jgi:hypothetical protein
MVPLYHTCNLTYIAQKGRDLKTHFNEHRRYIKTNNPSLAYAKHILNNKHKYRPAHTTIKLMKSCSKGRPSTKDN